MHSDYSPKALEIIACARALLAAGGYNGFSYADLSEAVHISKASIHHHFPTKAQLVQVVVALYRQEASAGMLAVERHVEDPRAQLEAYTGFWARCIRDGSLPLCICAMLAAEMPSIPAEVAAEVRGHFVDLSTWLAGVMQRGELHGSLELRTSPQLEGLALMATVHGAMLSARAQGAPELFATTVKTALDRLVPTA